MKRTKVVTAAMLALAVVSTGARAEAAPKRVVTLTPFTANVVAEVGAKPIAVGQVLGGRDRFDARLRGVRTLSLTHPAGPNLEQLATLNPDLVLSAPIWQRGHPAMKRLGMQVVESDPSSVAQVTTEARRIGRLLGRARQGDAAARRMEREIAAATKGIEKRPSVLLILGVGRSSMAFLPNSWGGDVVRRAGGRLLTEGLRAPGGFAKISNEFVVEQDPDVIIAVPHGAAGDLGKIADFLRDQPGWRTTTAARNGRIHVSQGNSLLQAWTSVGRTISDVRKTYLEN